MGGKVQFKTAVYRRIFDKGIILKLYNNYSYSARNKS